GSRTSNYSRRRWRSDVGGPTPPILAAVLFLPPGLGALPPLADANLVPPQAVTNAQIRSLIQRRYFLGIRLELEPHRRGHRQALLDDNTWRLEMWELLPEAQSRLLEEEDDTGTD